MSCSLDEIHQKQYEMLCIVDRICKENNLNYYLAQGTLLGAVRHGGFISWDDDIDVIIPYNDYVQFRKAFIDENNKDCFFSDYTTEKHCPYPWGKIRYNGTLSRPVLYKDIPVHWGICIDLFTAYYVSDFAPMRSLEILMHKIASKMIMAEMTQYETGRSLWEKALEKIPHSIRHMFLAMSQAVFNRNRNKSTEYMFLSCKGGRLIRRSILEDGRKEMIFESGMFRVPADSHSFLTKMYGDYMIPPPESERGGHELTMGKIEWKIF